MADTFGSLWRQVRLECPSAPALLVRSWALRAWRTVLDAKDWSFLVAEGGWTTSAQLTGTATGTSGSATITLGTLTASSTDVGRQFRRVGGTVYTIIAQGGGTLTLDRPYEGGSFTLQDAAIVSAYATMPTDFGRFDTLTDTIDGRSLHLFTSRDELQYVDPGRLVDGIPRYVLAAPNSPVVATLSALRYEFWPHATDVRTFAWRYYKNLTDPDDGFEFPGVWAQKRHVLLDGTLASCARWPGTTTQKNPFFNLALAKSLGDAFTAAIDDAMLLDENHDLTWLKRTPIDGELASPRGLTPHPEYDD